MTARRALTAIACALALAGCVAGPDYKSPEPDAPGQTPFAGAASSHVTSGPPAEQWWHLYESPALDGYIQEALKANTDLRVAEANLRQARAVLRSAKFARLPSTDIGASVNYGRQVGRRRMAKPSPKKPTRPMTRASMHPTRSICSAR